MPKKKTHDEFIKDVYNVVGTEYTVLEKYINSKSKLKIRHNCNFCSNNVYATTPASILSGRGCPVCAVEKVKNNSRKTHEFFIREVNSILGSDYIVLSNYINGTTKVKVKHICNSFTTNEYWVRPNSMLTGSGCAVCSRKKNNDLKRKSQTKFEQEVFNLLGDSYSVLGNYINSSTKITMRHNSFHCNKHVWDVLPFNILSKHCKCPACEDIKNRERLTKTDEQFKNEIYQKVGNSYTFLEDYKGYNTPLKVIHHSNKCNNYTYSVSPEVFLQGTRCPKCSNSKGEAMVSEILDKYKIDYKEQQYFYTDDNKRCIMDFVIYAGLTPLFGIEFDGKQHFTPVDFWGGDSTFKLQRERDSRKNKLFKDNGLPLLRIPYWDYKNIESIILQFLLDHTYLSKLKVSWSTELNNLLIVSGVNHTKYSLQNNLVTNLKTNVKFRVFKIGDILDIENTKSYDTKDVTDYKGDGEYINYVTSTVKTVGINKKVIFEDRFCINKGNELTYNPIRCIFHYQKEPYITGRNIFKIGVKNKNIGLYLATSLNNAAESGGFNSKNRLTPNILRDLKIKLPITKTGDIDYDYMDDYINHIKLHYIHNRETSVNEQVSLLESLL